MNRSSLSAGRVLTAHAGGAPRALNGLLPARFTAQDQFDHDASGILLQAQAAPSSAGGLVDLTVRLRVSNPMGSRAGGSDGVTALLLREMRDKQDSTRAAACQAAGQLRDRAFLPLLLQLASEDPEQYVQQTAQAAVTDIEMHVVTQEMLAQVALCLECFEPDAAGSLILGPVLTNAEGKALFEGVPRGVTCELRLAFAPTPDEQIAPRLARLLSSLTFHSSSQDQKRDGNCSISLETRAVGSPSHFGAMFRFSPPMSSLGADTLPGFAVARAHEYWSPSFVAPSAGLAWFNRLPRQGEYAARVSVSDTIIPPPGAEKKLFCLGEHRLLGESRCTGSVAVPPQVLHPADARLVALIEKGPRGEVVLTVETSAPELRGGHLRFLLERDQGELVFAGSGSFSRCSLRLRQAYRGDEATRLALQVVGCAA